MTQGGHIRNYSVTIFRSIAKTIFLLTMMNYMFENYCFCIICRHSNYYSDSNGRIWHYGGTGWCCHVCCPAPSYTGNGVRRPDQVICITPLATTPPPCTLRPPHPHSPTALASTIPSPPSVSSSLCLLRSTLFADCIAVALVL